MDGTNVAVVLTNGRSHVVDLPDGLDARTAAEVVRGVRRGAEVGWEAGDAQWLQVGNGQGWVNRDSLAEVLLVEYTADATYEHPVYD
jgi:hypothetical protein